MKSKWQQWLKGALLLVSSRGHQHTFFTSVTIERNKESVQTASHQYNISHSNSEKMAIKHCEHDMLSKCFLNAHVGPVSKIGIYIVYKITRYLCHIIKWMCCDSILLYYYMK